MDRELIEEKLEALRRAVGRLRDKCPEDPGRLNQDADLQDILAMNLTRGVQLSVDVAVHILSESTSPVPNSMGEAFDRLQEMGVIDATLAARMKSAVGFRNIVVHAYERIDWAIVHSICSTRLDDFDGYANAIQKALSVP